ncbi:MAG: hypothetical protein GTN62_15445 [Gemmatimonadales bacterium]|nr:hypothetical protein [Gemmatimonadales bacterium]NIN13206.1 hypothetical protein [Gemmatimonadales bacterium]NIN51484.1 hypothetical protein [Gemmatimonadales bacterium]NIP08948.1 hypothetical protein [Gemmatimonadales bacterium]NIR03736.1 hypothetical protein [Gemmatimonadales bacterium]
MERHLYLGIDVGSGSMCGMGVEPIQIRQPQGDFVATACGANHFGLSPSSAD